MINFNRTFALATLLSFSLIAPTQATVLDTFDYDVTLSADGAGSVDTDFFAGVSVPGGDVEYTLTVISDSNAFGNVTTNASVAAGYLAYDEASNVDSSLFLDYTDEDAGTPLDLTDLGTATAFYFDVLFADVGFTVDLVVTDIFDNVSTATFTLDHTINTSPERLYLSFASFTGSAIFAVTKSVTALINSLTGSDLVLDEVGTIPEPATLALFGLALLGFAAKRRSSFN